MATKNRPLAVWLASMRFKPRMDKTTQDERDKDQTAISSPETGTMATATSTTSS